MAPTLASRQQVFPFPLPRLLTHWLIRLPRLRRLLPVDGLMCSEADISGLQLIVVGCDGNSTCVGETVMTLESECILCFGAKHGDEESNVMECLPGPTCPP
jgi:hypothetical protein